VSQDELLAAIGEIARRLPPGQVLSLADTLDDCEAPAPEVKSRAVGAVASPAFADMARRLVQAWESEGGVSGSALAVALRAAARAVEEERRQESIEVVWTGPRTAAVPVRLTREVLIDVIRASRESLFVVSFAAYKVDVVLAELAAAAERGVVIRLILESGEAGGGRSPSTRPRRSTLWGTRSPSTSGQRRNARPSSADVHHCMPRPRSRTTTRPSSRAPTSPALGSPRTWSSACLCAEDRSLVAYAITSPSSSRNGSSSE
jgi:hypothetical protein